MSRRDAQALASGDGQPEHKARARPPVTARAKSNERHLPAQDAARLRVIFERLFFGWVKRGSSVEELAHYEFESLDVDRNGSVSREEDTRAGWYEKIQKSRWETVDESERFDLWDLDRDGTLDRSEVVKRAIERSRVDEAVAVERSCSDGVDGSCSDGEEGEEGDADEEDDEEDDEERDEL